MPIAPPIACLTESSGPVRNRAEVMARIRSQAPAIRAMGVDHCALFGSFGRDQGVTPSSDVDVLVNFRAGHKSLDSLMQLADLLEQLLMRPVDVVTREGISRHILGSVMAEASDVAIDA